MFKDKKIKPKVCKQCRVKFQPTKPLQHVCGFECALAYTLALKHKNEAIKQRKERAERKAKLKAMKGINELIKEAQTAFNAWIRWRDRNELCICCNEPYGTNELGGNYDAGHWRSRGAAGHLRFNEDNVFGQRKYCNTYRGGNPLGMREGMIKRIGFDRVEAVANNNDIHKWTREELIEIKETYRLKLKEDKLKYL